MVRNVAFRVLHPAGATVEEAVGRIRPASPPADRPYVIANFIATVDGSVSLAGESGTIAKFAPGDRPIFRMLREQADAILAGTGTLAAEGYRRLISNEAMRARRVAAGLQADALAVVFSRSGNIPAGVPMLEDPEQPRAVFTAADADPAAAFRVLRHEHGIGLLLCEGGPSLLGDLIRRDLVDELFLTIAPVIGSGTPERPLLGGLPDRPRPVQLRALLEESGGLHARYAMLAAGENSPADLTPGAHTPQ
jgi:riboflavin biosynthesis pyrimidine reductase